MGGDTKFGSEACDAESLVTSKKAKKKKKKKPKKKEQTEEEKLAMEMKALEEKIEVESKKDSEGDFEFTVIGVKKEAPKKDEPPKAFFNPLQ